MRSRTTSSFSAIFRTAAATRKWLLPTIVQGITILAVCGVWWPCVAEQPSENANPTRTELLALRDAVIKAYEARDIDGVLAHVHPDVIATRQNGVRARGREEVRQFFDEMMTGDSRIVRDVKSVLSVDGSSVMHGDGTAVACGILVDDFDLTSGTTLHLESKWTTTLVKLEGQWLIASFHVSANLFENPVLDAVRFWATTFTIAAGVAGLAIGLVGGRLLISRTRK